MKKNKGTVLTGVILMVLVMTLIGVPLLSMTVYNYRLVELSNSVKRSEYENEMAMDIMARIIRETVMDAIAFAKENAIAEVNEIAELQKSSYSSVYAKYEAIWINAYNECESGSGCTESVREILGGCLYKKSEETKAESKKEYIESNIEKEMNKIKGEETYVENFLDETGIVNQEELDKAYNDYFSSAYKAYISDQIEHKKDYDTGKEKSRILVKDKYINIISDKDNIDVTGDVKDPADEIFKKENYLIIASPKIRGVEPGIPLEIDVSSKFRKNSTTPPTTLSATFVINTPGFDTVASITQENITLSNAVLNQGGITVGGQLILNNTILKTNSDITVLGSSDTNINNAILVGKDSKLLAEDASGNATKSRIVSAKDILLKAGSTLKTGTSPIYYRNLYVGESDESIGNVITVNFSGDAVAEDDLEINYEGAAKIIQETGANYYGFNDVNNKGPDASSSIIFNSNELNNKTLTLGNLYLAGRAFIEGVTGTQTIYKDDGITVDNEADRTYKTGESIAIKGNYVAYQTPLFDSEDDMFNPSKVNFSDHFMNSGSAGDGTQNIRLKLADGFTEEGAPSNFNGSFDVNYKWKYFKDYARIYKSEFDKRSIAVSSNVKYIEGTSFDENGKVKDSTNEIITDMSFRENLAVEYEKYTKYFGYRPVDKYGDLDTNKAKTSIFGSNGWIKDFSDSDKSSDDYYQILTNGSKTIELSGSGNEGIIICKGDLTINVSGTAAFKGVIIVGGNLTINGGTLILEDGKDVVINNVIGNYLGSNTSITGNAGTLYGIFTYDGSGSSYIVTEIGDNLININDLIGITNWKKFNYGRL